MGGPPAARMIAAQELDFVMKNQIKTNRQRDKPIVPVGKHYFNKTSIAALSRSRVLGVVSQMRDNTLDPLSTPCKYSVDQTVEKLKGILKAKGVMLFALIDHSGEAEKAGMKMPPTKLLLFGSPKAGTPLMLAVPSIAIDLPLKILIWEDIHGKVWVSYNSTAYLQTRYSLPPDLGRLSL